MPYQFKDTAGVHSLGSAEELKLAESSANGFCLHIDGAERLFSEVAGEVGCLLEAQPMQQLDVVSAQTARRWSI